MLLHDRVPRIVLGAGDLHYPGLWQNHGTIAAYRKNRPSTQNYSSVEDPALLRLPKATYKTLHFMRNFSILLVYAEL